MVKDVDGGRGILDVESIDQGPLWMILVWGPFRRCCYKGVACIISASKNLDLDLRLTVSVDHVKLLPERLTCQGRCSPLPETTDLGHTNVEPLFLDDFTKSAEFELIKLWPSETLVSRTRDRVDRRWDTISYDSPYGLWRHITALVAL